MRKRMSGPTKKNPFNHPVLARLVANNFSDIGMNTELKTRVLKNDLKMLMESAPEDFSNYLFECPLPKNFSALKSSRLYKPSQDFDRETHWCYLTVTRHAARINAFLEMKYLFERQMLAGAYEQAQATLDRVDAEICSSFWSIENRLLLEEYSRGLESNKQYLSYLNKQKLHPFVLYIAQYLSMKAEKSMSAYNYIKRIEDRFEAIDDVELKPVLDFIKYRLNRFKYRSAVDPSHVLWSESSSSLIDRYLTFRDIIIDSVTTARASELGNFPRIVQNLQERIKDKLWVRLDLVTNGVQKMTLSGLDKAFYSCCDKYTEGDYSASFSLAEAGVRQYSEVFGFYDLYVKSKIRIDDITDGMIFGNNEALGNVILTCMYDILSKNKDAYAAYNKLYRTAYALSSFDIANDILLFLSGNNKLQLRKVEYAAKLLTSRVYNVKLVDLFQSPRSKASYLGELARQLPSSSTVTYWQGAVAGTLGKIATPAIPLERRMIYTASQCYKDGAIADAIKLYQELLLPERKIRQIPFKYQEVINDLCLCYLQNGQIDDAVSLVVSNYMDNPLIVDPMTLTSLVEKAEEHKGSVDVRKVAYPILYHIAGLDLQKRYEGYAKFMRSHKLRRPMDLFRIGTGFPEDQMFYFLEEICNTDIMYKSVHFSGTEDIEQERISILQKLSERYEHKEKVYNKEINEITKRGKIRKCVQHVDESKIQFDVKGIRSSSEKSIKESFERFIKFSEFTRKDLLLLDTHSTPLIDHRYMLDIRATYTDKHVLIPFKEIFYDIRDKFISKNQYGLDCYLSSKIRHGSLVGQLNKPFTAHNLTCLKDKDGNFLHNEFWSKKLLCHSQALNAEIQEKLARFTRQIDDLCGRIKNEMIQVRTEKTMGLGLFDYSFFSEELDTKFFESYYQISDFDEFFSKVIKDLEDRTEFNLKVVRAKIETEIKTEFMRCLNNLQGELTARPDRQLLIDLCNAIASCRTSVQLELANLGRWFNIGQSQSIDEFDLELAIETCTDILFNVYKKRLKISQDIDDSLPKSLPGKLFVHFVDMFYILFDNIVKRSMLPIEDIFVEITAKRVSHSLSFSIRNNLSPDFPVDEEKEKVRTIFSDIKEGKNLEKYGLEGGTGYYKISRILKYELGCSIYYFSTNFNTPGYCDVDMTIGGLI